jgi:uncharacterized membrane protein YkvA (DUF1232 family)
MIELNGRERRLYDRLRSQVITSEPGDGSGLRDLVLLAPDLAVLTLRLLRDERVPPGGKAFALLGIGYMLSPLDLIPDLLLGPIAWIDDVVVLAACLSRIVNYVHPDVVNSHWSGQGDALEAVQRITEWSESLLTTRIPRTILRAVGLSS